MPINKHRDNAVKPTAERSGILFPSITFLVAETPKRIWVQPGRIDHMESALDAALDKAREAGGTGLAIEIFDPKDRLVVRRAVPDAEAVARA